MSGKTSILQFLTRKTLIFQQLIITTFAILAVWIFNQFDFADNFVTRETEFFISVNRIELYLVLMLIFLNLLAAYFIFRRMGNNPLIKYSMLVMMMTFLILSVWLVRIFLFDGSIITKGIKLEGRISRFEVIVVLLLIFGNIMASLSLFRKFNKAAPYLTMSAQSKKVEYDGDWISIEEYLQREIGVVVSHSITPEEKEAALAQFRKDMAEQQ